MLVTLRQAQGDTGLPTQCEKEPKKIPPLRCKGLLMINDSSTYIESKESVVTLTAFLKTVIGTTRNNKMNFRHKVVRKRWAARIPVIRSAILDLIPLHSSATSTLIVGKWNINPSRNIGIPIILKSTYHNRDQDNVGIKWIINQ
jgi:hypothetical protein